MKTAFICFHLSYVPSAVGNHSEVRDSTTMTTCIGTYHSTYMTAHSIVEG